MGIFKSVKTMNVTADDPAILKEIEEAVKSMKEV
jgi:hypothetical protein